MTEPLDGLVLGCTNSSKLTGSYLYFLVAGGLISFTSLLIFSTNLLVAAVLLKLILKQSSRNWCFVLNLAVADSLVGVSITGVATENFSAYYNNGSYIPSSGSYTYGKRSCLIRMACVTTPFAASIFSMFLISLDRYVSIRRPLHYAQLLGKWVVAGSLLVLWIISFSVGFAPVMVQQLQADSYDGFCAFFSVNRQPGITILFSAFFFPVICMFVYMYMDILRISYSHQKQISQVREAVSRASDHPQQQQQQQHQNFWGHIRALRTVVVVVGCFLGLWCPFFVVCIVQILCKSPRLTSVLENYLWLLGMFNSLMNPLVYAFWQREFRLQLSDSCSCFTRLFSVRPPGADQLPS
ncbi:uncharacterized protein V6R79_002147 [Siganus canaliculatus]